MVWLLNIIIPGTGLVVRRREWLGFSLAIMFGLCGNVTLAGWLIAPAAVPAWLTRLASALAALTWVAAQLLLHRQGTLLKRRASGLAALLREAHSALEAGDTESARLALESGAAVDDEAAELYVLRARLCDLVGDDRGARAARRRIHRLDRRRRRRCEVRPACGDESPATDAGA